MSKNRQISFMTKDAARKEKARKQERMEEDVESGSLRIYHLDSLSPQKRTALERRWRMR